MAVKKTASKKPVKTPWIPTIIPGKGVPKTNKVTPLPVVRSGNKPIPPKTGSPTVGKYVGNIAKAIGVTPLPKITNGKPKSTGVPRPVIRSDRIPVRTGPPADGIYGVPKTGKLTPLPKITPDVPAKNGKLTPLPVVRSGNKPIPKRTGGSATGKYSPFIPRITNGSPKKMPARTNKAVKGNLGKKTQMTLHKTKKIK